LFMGPPGNGKTHAVKAIINSLKKPCIYVRSFKSQYSTAQDCITALFSRARKSAPCILVFEDLDSLIDDDTRAFLLNELDGFASNAGLLTLATTNHPEKLDAAILERPSRFDRKYHFALPTSTERLAYLKMWNERLAPAMRFSEAGLQARIEQTEGFSFAFLKELVLSSIMRWMDGSPDEPMDQVSQTVQDLLRHQIEQRPAPVQPGSLERWFAKRMDALRLAFEERVRGHGT
jgi:AAA+ superfamily predicted ATPase